jgi:hypothetical protein
MLVHIGEKPPVLGLFPTTAIAAVRRSKKARRHRRKRQAVITPGYLFFDQ